MKHPKKTPQMKDSQNAADFASFFFVFFFNPKKSLEKLMRA